MVGVGQRPQNKGGVANLNAKNPRPPTLAALKSAWGLYTDQLPNLPIILLYINLIANF